MSSHGSDSSADEHKGDNPFDFDVDFAQVQRQRRAKVQQESHKEEAAQSILEGMDAVDEDVSTSKPKGRRRPNLIHQRKKTTTTELPSKTGGSRFFSAFMSGADETPVENYTADEYVIQDGPFKVGSRCLSVWPFDDYHLVQKMYYEKLQDGESKMSADEPQDDSIANNDQQSSIPIFSRPADPPDIPTAVQGLSLTEFERKAEERSIQIVSCWLFDAGLIDELLVNGGISSLASDNNDGRSVQTSEGIEVGAAGYPLEGSTKMDKEIAKLRHSTKRQLALINARLNDGVAATGSEVQELVNAVIATKDDLGRLRELSTYVSNPNNVEQTSQFMLTKYPKLKQAINARRNLSRCFHELDYFNHISSKCDRLREELQAGEWTAHEWSTIRSVCRDHVGLEMFLVEAEAGMKQRSDEDVPDESLPKGRSRRGERRTSNKFGRQAFAKSGLVDRNNTALIDRFLEEHVDNVWDLGKEIRGRIMQGIGDAFELAMTNPAGMVALAEAVEVYESANEEYKRVHGEDSMRSTKMRFTEMRPAALGELYKNFEDRGETVFQEVKRQAADAANEDDASNQQFTAVLRAANELTSEIGIVKEQMVPCFPPNWEIETLWTTCVAHVCSTNILQQIGGLEGRKLENLSAAQLLDLVAWVETFRDIIEETFPNLGESTSKRSYNDKPPNLLSDDGKRVDIQVAHDSLAWVQNTLWEVHDMAKVDFLARTQNQTKEWLANVYDNRDQHTRTQTSEGRLVTSLCEDVFAVAGTQLRTIRDRLTRKSEAMAQAVGVVLQTLYKKQIESRESFCSDFETCCAAANDFVRMSEKCEEIIDEIKEESNLSPAAIDTLDEQAHTILALYFADACYAAQKTHLYCFEPIEDAIASELFGPEWEKELTHNELALTLVRTLDDFMEDLEAFLDEVMVQRAVEAQVASSVNFYVKCLLRKASEHNSNRVGCFGDNNMMALGRMRADIHLIREYFDNLCESMPTLSRVIEHEFGPLDSILEILTIAAGISNSDIADFAILLQKRVKNVVITRFVIGDLYHLVNPGEEKKVIEQLESLEEQMVAVAPTDEKAVRSALDRKTVPGLRLDQTMASCLVRSKRKRPIRNQSLEDLNAALDEWRASVRDQEI